MLLEVLKTRKKYHKIVRRQLWIQVLYPVGPYVKFRSVKGNFVFNILRDHIIRVFERQ